MNNKTGTSLRRLSSKFKVSFKTISNQLKAMSIYYHKKRRALRYSDKQLQEIPTRACRLYRLLSKDNFQLIMDDEKYFMFHNESVPSNCGFYTSNPSTVSPELKFRRTQKFEPKVLVGIAISENGVSEPFLAKQKQAISQETYFRDGIIAR